MDKPQPFSLGASSPEDHEDHDFDAIAERVYEQRHILSNSKLDLEDDNAQGMWPGYPAA